MPTYWFTAPFSQFDKYTDDGEEMVDFEREDDQYVVFLRSEWEALGSPKRVLVTIEPYDE